MHTNNKQNNEIISGVASQAKISTNVPPKLLEFLKINLPKAVKVYLNHKMVKYVEGSLATFFSEKMQIVEPTIEIRLDDADSYTNLQPNNNKELEESIIVSQQNDNKIQSEAVADNTIQSEAVNVADNTIQSEAVEDKRKKKRRVSNSDLTNTSNNEANEKFTPTQSDASNNEANEKFPPPQSDAIKPKQKKIRVNKSEIVWGDAFYKTQLSEFPAHVLQRITPSKSDGYINFQTKGGTVHEYSISENGYCELCDIMLRRYRYFAHSETNWHMVNLKLKQLNLVDA